MKLFLPTFTTGIVAISASLQAAPDFSEVNEGVDHFFKAMDGIAKKLPAVNDAAGTAEIINTWSLANETFAAVGERFVAENPDALNQKEPPPEFAAAMGRLNRLNTDYAAVPAGVGALIKRFQGDPQVIEAMKRFQKSLQRVQQVGQKGEQQK